MSEKPLSRREAEEMWEKSEPIKLERTSRAMTSLLSVRLPRDVLRQLTLAARQQRKGPATLARELIEQGLTLQDAEVRPIFFRVLARFLEKMEGSGARSGRKPS